MNTEQNEEEDATNTIIIISIGATVLLINAAVICYFFCRKAAKNTENTEQGEIETVAPPLPRPINEDEEPPSSIDHDEFTNV